MVGGCEGGASLNPPPTPPCRHQTEPFLFKWKVSPPKSTWNNWLLTLKPNSLRCRVRTVVVCVHLCMHVCVCVCELRIQNCNYLDVLSVECNFSSNSVHLFIILICLAMLGKANHFIVGFHFFWVLVCGTLRFQDLNKAIKYSWWKPLNL